MKTPINEQFLGTLHSDTEVEIYLKQRAANDHILPATALSRTNITEFTTTTRKKPERIHVASCYAHSFLDLQSTPWTSEALKESLTIITVTPSPQATERQSYLFHSFGGSAPTATPINNPAPLTAQTNEPPPTPKQALFNLGVLLLELFFGQSLEHHPFREKYLNNGQPNRFTEFCTAKEWHEQVAPEFGDEVSDAIERLLVCGFGPVPDFTSEEFLQALYDDVIQPLDRFLALFKGQIPA